MKPEKQIPKHHPKGGMCAACQSIKNDCSNLDFKMMPVIKVDGSHVVVKCTEFKR